MGKVTKLFMIRDITEFVFLLETIGYIYINYVSIACRTFIGHDIEIYPRVQHSVWVDMTL